MSKNALANYQVLDQRIKDLNDELNKLTDIRNELRLKELQRVQLIRNTRHDRLKFNNRNIQAFRNGFDYLMVVEDGQVLDQAFKGNVHDLRFAVATGQI